MEPVTHLLTGAALARSGFNRTTALATVTMVLAAEAPDIDIVAYVRGSAYGFIEHRGITHTFIGVPFIAALVLLLVWAGDTLWQRFRPSFRKQLTPRRWGLLYLYACIAVLSHLLLDFITAYGLRPFYPFSPRWYSWDIVFIIEPLMLAALFLGLTLPGLFSLVGSEIGERSRKYPRGRGLAIASLLFMVALWGVRDFEHRRAIAALDAFEYRGAPAVRVAAFPTMVNPFRWAGVVETGDSYIAMQVDSLAPQVDPDNHARSYFKPATTPVNTAARSTSLGRAYVDWARFPVLEAEHLVNPPGELVRFNDVRYMGEELRSRRPLEAFVLLDSQLQPEEQGFGEPKAQR